MLKRVSAILLSLSLCATLAIGCTAAKKPAPQPVPETSDNREAPRVKAPAAKSAGLPTSSPELHKLATKLADEATKVQGVRKATVVLSGTTAFVGIDLDAKMTGKQTDTIKKDVATRINRAEKRVKKVYVSSDIGTVSRIRRVAQGIGEGQPISSFSAELAEISRRLLPSTSK